MGLRKLQFGLALGVARGQVAPALADAVQETAGQGQACTGAGAGAGTLRVELVDQFKQRLHGRGWACLRRARSFGLCYGVDCVVPAAGPFQVQTPWFVNRHGQAVAAILGFGHVVQQAARLGHHERKGQMVVGKHNGRADGATQPVGFHGGLVGQLDRFCAGYCAVQWQQGQHVVPACIKRGTVVIGIDNVPHAVCKRRQGRRNGSRLARFANQLAHAVAIHPQHGVKR